VAATLKRIIRDLTGTLLLLQLTLYCEKKIRGQIFLSELALKKMRPDRYIKAKWLWTMDIYRNLAAPLTDTVRYSIPKITRSQRCCLYSAILLWPLLCGRPLDHTTRIACPFVRPSVCLSVLLTRKPKKIRRKKGVRTFTW